MGALGIVVLLWLWLCGAAITLAVRATSDDSVYNTTIPKELTWEKRTRSKSVGLKLFAESKDEDILRRADPWFRGAEELARSRLTAKKRVIKEHAAANGSKE